MKLLLAAALSVACTTAMAAETCQTKAVDKNNKKLAGAALTANMKKCQGDATAMCAKQAEEKKLRGAAQASFTKKCYNDAVGTS